MSRCLDTEFEDAADARPGLEDSGHQLLLGAFSLVVIRRGFYYRESPPPPGLGDVIACTWHSEVVSPDVHHLRVVPDGCTEIVYAQERGVLVYGPGVDWSDIALQPGARQCGIRLRPAAASAALRLTMTELGGKVVTADDIAGLRAWNRSSPNEWLESAFENITKHIGRRPPDRTVARAVATLTNHPAESVADVAKEVGVSERQLRRKFGQAVGLAPASYRRIARMRRAVTAAVSSDACSWARIATEVGYSDQSHLARELRSLTGMRPRELVG